MEKQQWNYTVSTCTIWTSFDYGTVEAETYEEALEKAEVELKNNFAKANEALKSVGLSVEFEPSQIQVEKVPQPNSAFTQTIF